MSSFCGIKFHLQEGEISDTVWYAGRSEEDITDGIISRNHIPDMLANPNTTREALSAKQLKKETGYAFEPAIEKLERGELWICVRAMGTRPMTKEEKKRLKITPPHEKVYVRLGASPLHGVGVFAVRRIKKGTNPFQGDDSTMVWYPAEKVKRLPEGIRKLYQDFGVLKEGRYGVPPNFNQLTPAWYLNHSQSDPNMRCGEDYDFFATRDIEPGEELTINYDTYSE